MTHEKTKRMVVRGFVNTHPKCKIYLMKFWCIEGIRKTSQGLPYHDRDPKVLGVLVIVKA
jgi:hypothetical protein